MFLTGYESRTIIHFPNIFHGNKFIIDEANILRVPPYHS